MLATNLKHLNTSVGRMWLQVIHVRTSCVLDMETEAPRGCAASPMGITEHGLCCAKKLVTFLPQPQGTSQDMTPREEAQFPPPRPGSSGVREKPPYLCSPHLDLDVSGTENKRIILRLASEMRAGGGVGSGCIPSSDRQRAGWSRDSVGSWFSSFLEKHTVLLRRGHQPDTSLRGLIGWLLRVRPISAEFI